MGTESQGAGSDFQDLAFWEVRDFHYPLRLSLSEIRRPSSPALKLIVFRAQDELEGVAI